MLQATIIPATLQANCACVWPGGQCGKILALQHAASAAGLGWLHRTQHPAKHMHRTQRRLRTHCLCRLAALQHYRTNTTLTPHLFARTWVVPYRAAAGATANKADVQTTLIHVQCCGVTSMKQAFRNQRNMKNQPAIQGVGRSNNQKCSKACGLHTHTYTRALNVSLVATLSRYTCRSVGGLAPRMCYLSTKRHGLRMCSSSLLAHPIIWAEYSPPT
jgi:hypothetical protein